MMNWWTIPFLALVVGVPGLCAASKPRLSDFLELPPVLDRTVGNPVVNLRVNPEASKTTVTVKRSPLHLPKSAKIDGLEVEAPTAKSSLSGPLARAVLDFFWDHRLQEAADHKVVSLIPMSHDRFVSVGTGQLTGRPVNDVVGNAWWKVRMGEPLTPDDDHHLIVMAAKSPEEFYSHFALGLRKTGSDGSRQDDWVLDPRAPWLKDTHPTIIDWFNFDNSMLMTVELSHLSDWMYTQTAFRGYGVTMQFTPATEEHVTLLRAAGRSGDIGRLNLGPFKPLRNNCATHGQELIETLLPLDEKLCGRHPLADLPKRIIRKTGRRLGIHTTVEVPPQPAPSGVEQSQNSTLRQSPDPTKTPEVRQLRGIPEIN